MPRSLLIGTGIYLALGLGLWLWVRGVRRDPVHPAAMAFGGGLLCALLWLPILGMLIGLALWTHRKMRAPAQHQTARVRWWRCP